MYERQMVSEPTTAPTAADDRVITPDRFPGQARLEVGAAHDRYEVEADQVARAVVQRLRRGMQHDEQGEVAEHRDHGEHEGADAAPIARRIQRRGPIGADGGEVDGDTESRISRMRGGGRPLGDQVRRQMEGAFGTDFGQVRLHEGSESASLNASLGAEAFTTGNDIFFRDGLPSNNDSGRELLAHELTHTIQQGGGVGRRVQRKASKSAARIVSATLATTERSEPTIKGHSMKFDLVLDIPGKAGPEKVKDIDAEVARSLYGVTFEWWEEIIVDYDFTEADGDLVEGHKAAGRGSFVKPWSDIYLANPQSQTFFSWKNSLAAARAGSLAGTTHTTGVLDRPAVNLSADSYKRRTLRFRIDASDAHGNHEKFDAIQVLKVDNGVLTSSYYTDSTGTVHSKGTGESEIMRYRSTVPAEIRRSDAVRFAKEAEGRKRGVRAFVDSEFDQVEQEARRVSNGNEMVYNMERGNIHKDMQQGNRLNGAPLIPSSHRYVEFDASDGGLLVAEMAGKKVVRMFYTRNVPSTISVNVNGQPVQMSVRGFEQIPRDMFAPGS